MSEPRKAMVHKLVEQAMAGMESAATDATADEVLSACVTVCARALRVAAESGGNRAKLREAVYGLLLDLPDEGKGN